MLGKVYCAGQLKYDGVKPQMKITKETLYLIALMTMLTPQIDGATLNLMTIISI